MRGASRFSTTLARLTALACAAPGVLPPARRTQAGGLFIVGRCAGGHVATVSAAGMPVMPRMGYASGLFPDTF
jgi:hypothetical protein